MRAAILLAVFTAVVPSHALGILGGSLDATHPAVVLVVTDYGPIAHLCTGVLVAPELVLTAAQCTATLSKPTKVVPASSVRVCTGQDPGTACAADAIGVSAIDVPEDAFSGNDLALLQLSKSIDGVTPLAVHLTELSASDAGATVVVVGDGVTGPSADDAGTRRAVSMTIGSVSASPAQFTLSGASAGTCGGDTGAPALSFSNEVLGLAVSAQADCTSPVFQDLGADAAWLGARIPPAPEGGSAGQGGAGSSDGGPKPSGGGGGCGTGGAQWPSLLGCLAAAVEWRRRRGGQRSSQG
jgi:hypothetical protein